MKRLLNFYLPLFLSGLLIVASVTYWQYKKPTTVLALTTTASLTQSTWNDAGAATTAFFSVVPNAVVSTGSDPANSFFRFTMPANPGGGVISQVTLDAACNANGFGINGVGYDIHKVTQTGWVESTMTWNKYDGTNNWATPGGDYSGTIINTIPSNPCGGLAVYFHSDIMGGAATNPLTLNWGDQVDLVITGHTNAAGSLGMDGRPSPTNPPTLTITYTVVATSDALFFAGD